jgi:hypothetical protein
MRRSAFSIVAIALTILYSSATSVFPDIMVLSYGSGTQIGGILWNNTIWNLANSPYTITSTVQIPGSVTLTIQPGVVVNTLTGGTMFLVSGRIIAHGSASEMITFDGGGVADFFDMRNMQSSTTIDLDYCRIENGNTFWISDRQMQWASFSMSHSEMENIASSSNMRSFVSTNHNIRIQFNKFVNSACFIIGNDPEVPLYITNNVFTQNGYGPALGLFYLYDTAVIEKNSFVNMNGIAIRLFAPSGTDVNISNNYWGTTNTTVIDSMIYDGYDDIRIEGHLLYQPVLTVPSPDTPIAPAIPEYPTFLVPLLIMAILVIGMWYHNKERQLRILKRKARLFLVLAVISIACYCTRFGNKFWSNKNSCIWTLKS